MITKVTREILAESTEPIVSVDPPQRQPFSKTLAQLWGIFFLAFLFGMGGYRLIHKGYSLYVSGEGTPMDAYDYFLFAVLLLLGAGKAYMIFQRKMVPRTLARARKALGETGWKWDYLLAPFCMLSLYRPWQKKHAILSWIVIPVMVALAVSFIVIVPDNVFKSAVDWAVGLALAYAAALYVVAFCRVLGWSLTGAKEDSHPLPAEAP